VKFTFERGRCFVDCSTSESLCLGRADRADKLPLLAAATIMNARRGSALAGSGEAATLCLHETDAAHDVREIKVVFVTADKRRQVAAVQNQLRWNHAIIDLRKSRMNVRFEHVEAV
jgi:hypothetical protein